MPAAASDGTKRKIVSVGHPQSEAHAAKTPQQQNRYQKTKSVNSLNKLLFGAYKYILGQAHINTKTLVKRLLSAHIAAEYQTEEYEAHASVYILHIYTGYHNFLANRQR